MFCCLHVTEKLHPHELTTLQLFIASTSSQEQYHVVKQRRCLK
jgi:hypothetical protein